MKKCAVRLLGAGLICVCLAQTGRCRAAAGREFVGDLVFDRDMAVDLAAGTAQHPRLAVIEWIRIEAKYGNSWGITARVGWSPAVETTWRIRTELLDGQGRVLSCARDRPTVFTGLAGSGPEGTMRYADLGLEPLMWDGRRHATRIRLTLEPAEERTPAEAASLGMVVAAVDGSRQKPIPDATIVVEVQQEAYRQQARVLLGSTDAQGECRISVTKTRLTLVGVQVQKDGYVSISQAWSNWSSGTPAEAPLLALPERHVLETVPARTIGGMAQDAQGRPVAGVQVMIETHLQEVGGTVSVRRHVLTDPAGRWQAGGIPSDAETVSLGFRHPQYESDHFAGRRLTGEQLQDAYAGRHVAVLNPGLAVRGIVLDEQGKPVPHAAVVLAPRGYGMYRYEYAYVVTDAAGRFQFACGRNDKADATREGGSTAVLVEAAGYPAVWKQVVVEPNLAPLELRLQPGRTLALRVVGPDEQPVAGAWVAGHPLLEDPRYLVWLGDTDAEGRVRLTNAPQTEVRLSVLKGGYTSIRDLSLFPAREEHVVKLEPAPRVQGTVVDAQTGQPVADFEVTPASPSARVARTSKALHFQNGRFELRFEEAESEPVQLRISAPGYAAATSEPIPVEGTRVLEFKLVKDPSFREGAIPRAGGAGADERLGVIKGVVRDPAGRPVPNVSMTMMAPAWYAMDTATDAQGAFKLRWQALGISRPDAATPHIIVRDSARNLAAAVEVDLPAVRDLAVQLQPGASFVGRITDVQGKGIPGATASLTFWNGNTGRALREAAKSDPNGTFEIRAVPPGHRYSITATAEGYGQTYTMNLDAPESRGEAALAPVAVEPLVLAVANLDLTGTALDGEGNPVAEARVFCYGRNQPNRQTETDALGRFAFHNVCAGPIQIQANTMGTTNLYGMLQTEGGATDVTIVLGSRPSAVAARPPSLVGKPLPALASLGRELPEEARDKMILLCFFEMTQRPSRRALAVLTQQADDLRQKDVVILAVRAGEADASAVAEWVKEQGITLPISAITGDTRRTRFAWSVESLPWLILADRRHVIRAQGFALDELNKKIEEADAVK